MADIVVGVAEMAVSDNPTDIIITRALGSCVAIVVYDAKMRVGGILHYQLPWSSGYSQKALTNPFMFADTGIPALLGEIANRGGRVDRLTVKMAGGSNVLDPEGLFNIGKSNYLAARQILWRHGLRVSSEDVGGDKWRNVFLRMLDCAVFIETCDGQRVL